MIISNAMDMALPRTGGGILSTIKAKKNITARIIRLSIVGGVIRANLEN